MDPFDSKSKLLSLLSSLRIFPNIHYSSGSKSCQSVAQILSAELDSLDPQSKKDFKHTSTALLLIVDRQKDQITPLRLPWYYQVRAVLSQAMLYEHLDFSHGIVKYGGLAQKEASLSELYDDFYRDNMYDNFGKIIQKSTNFLVAVKNDNQSHATQGKTLEELEYVAEKLPEIKRNQNLSIKHFEIIECLADLVQRFRLMDMNQTEVQLLEGKVTVNSFDVDWKII
jgi:vacuolar protein sorting-associated protein 45